MAQTEFIADLTNYKDRVGSRIPEGTYTFRIDDAELTKARSGNTMIVLSLEVLNGPEAGAIVVDRLVMSEAALFRVVGFLRALGIPTPKKRLKLDTKRFLNRRVVAEVADGEPYRNSVKSEVVNYSKAESSGSDESEDLEDLEDLDDVTNDEIEDLEDVEEVEVEEKVKAKKKSKPEPVEEEDEEDEDSDDDDEEIDLDDLTI